MVYSGFWRRFAALIIDKLIVIGCTFDFVTLAIHSRNFLIVATIPLAAIITAYYIYYHASFGQTLGKKLMRIKVVTMDGSPICLKKAVQRNLIDMVVMLLFSLSYINGLSLMSDSEFVSLTRTQINSRVNELNSAFGLSWLFWLYCGLGWLDDLVLFTNWRNRTLHDFIANTVVIRFPSNTIKRWELALCVFLIGLFGLSFLFGIMAALKSA
ncbi:MAG: RDD family protein [Methyloglobulus sp.]|nr:RDD family protein [Methyloglobulus sp.]